MNCGVKHTDEEIMAADSSQDSAAHGVQRSTTGVAVHRNTATGQAAHNSRGALARRDESIGIAASVRTTGSDRHAHSPA